MIRLLAQMTLNGTNYIKSSISIIDVVEVSCDFAKVKIKESKILLSLTNNFMIRILGYEI